MHNVHNKRDARKMAIPAAPALLLFDSPFASLRDIHIPFLTIPSGHPDQSRDKFVPIHIMSPFLSFYSNESVDTTLRLRV
jgi:hypothetical protein